MGGNMVRRLLRGKHECVVYARSAETRKQFAAEGATPAETLDDLIKKLKPPRAVWLMVPSGDVTEQNVQAVSAKLEKGDILIDGGNSYFKDDVRRAKALRAKGIEYVDVGTSGGVWGLERGYCLMIGGEKAAVQHLEPIFKTLAPGRGDTPPSPGREKRGGTTASDGYLHCGPVGAGHFIKMVHNGIEYGLMQAYGEGLDIIESAKSDKIPEDQRYDFNLSDITELWRRGSVVGSWLLDLVSAALAEDTSLGKFTGWVEDSGEGRWTILTAVEEAVPADVLSSALYVRFRSREQHTFAEKVLSAMRAQFGGHKEPGK
jgi:6-phosphogluconate dehydrogenase